MPDDDAELEALIATLDPTAQVVVKLIQKSNAELKAMLAVRDEQLAEFQRMLFGKRTEKLPRIESEVRRAIEKDELAPDAKPPSSDPKEQAAVKKAKQTKRRKIARKKSEPQRKLRRKLRKKLPVVQERCTVLPEDLPDGYSLNDFRELGQGGVIRRVDHVREHLVVVEYRLQTLTSKDGLVVVKAEAPPSVVEGGHYGTGLHAHVVVAKCADSLPLYRIEKMLERAGHSIARSSLCALFHRSAELLRPIYDRMLEQLKLDPYLHADETTLPVMREGGCHRGWVWAVLSKENIIYAYDESRGGHVAERLIGESEGTLVIDGYSGYNVVISDLARTRVGCWSHSRRKFWVAMQANPAARVVLEFIVELYKVEHRAAERGLLGTDAHLLLRQTESKPIVDLIDKWVDENEDGHHPKGHMAKAVTYATNQRKALRQFLEDPKLPLDNNFSERALRIFALGRKNYLFSGHAEGAQNLAILQSIVATCRLQGVNPYEYIKDVLIRVQTHPASKIEEILPANWLRLTGDG